MLIEMQNVHQWKKIPLDYLLFNLLLILIPSQLGRHFWLAESFVMGIRIDYLSFTLYLTDILVFLILLLWLRNRKFWRKIHIPKPVIMAFIVGIAVNIFMAQRPLLALIDWLKWCELGLLSSYVAGKIKKLSLVNRSVLLIAVSIVSILGIWQFTAQHSIGGVWWLVGERTFTVTTPGIATTTFGPDNHHILRSYATFPHPNVFGGFLVVLLTMLWAQLLSKREKNSKYYVYLGAVTFVAIGALVTTGSKTAGIVAVFGFIECSLLYAQKHLKLSSVVVNAGHGAALIAVVLIFFLVQLAFLKDEAVIVRQNLNSAAFTMIKQNPFAGVGLNNFITQIPFTLPVTVRYAYLQPVHNMYLLFASETGLLGILGLILLALQFNRKIKFTPALIPLLQLALIGMVDHYPYTLQQTQLLSAIVLGYYLSGLLKVQKRNDGLKR